MCVDSGPSAAQDRAPIGLVQPRLGQVKTFSVSASARSSSDSPLMESAWALWDRGHQVRQGWCMGWRVGTGGARVRMWGSMGRCAWVKRQVPPGLGLTSPLLHLLDAHLDKESWGRGTGQDTMGEGTGQDTIGRGSGQDTMGGAWPPSPWHGSLQRRHRPELPGVRARVRARVSARVRARVRTL